MIRVTRLNNEVFFVNHDLIEFIEETPDTVLSMESGRKVIVTESADEIIRQIIDFRRQTANAVPAIR